LLDTLELDGELELLELVESDWLLTLDWLELLLSLLL